MKKKTRNRIIGAVIAAVIISAAIYAGWYYTIGPGSTATPGDGSDTDQVFSIVVKDGSRGVAIDLDEVRANLYLLPETAVDLTGGDWTEFENQTGVDTMNEIDESDLQTAHFVMAVVIYWIVNVDLEDVNGDDSDLQEDENVAYYQREARLYAGRLNLLYIYETMENGGQFTVRNANTGVVINSAAANISSPVNFTIEVMATNMSAFNLHQKYVSFWSYQNDAWADLSLTLTFNDTCQKQEFSVSGGLSIARPSATSLSYSWSYLDAISIQMYRFTWHTNVTGVWPTSADLKVDSVGHPIVLAYNGVAI